MVLYRAVCTDKNNRIIGRSETFKKLKDAMSWGLLASHRDNVINVSVVTSKEQKEHFWFDLADKVQHSAEEWS